MHSKTDFKQHGQVGGMGRNGDIATRRGLWPTVLQVLQGLAAAGLIVLLFGAAGWLDQYAEDQHQLAQAQRRQVMDSAFHLGVARGHAEMAAINKSQCERGL